MSSKQVVKLGERGVGAGCPTYVIAEIGSNHDQQLDTALDMISRAAEAGANAVKFQSLRFDELYHPHAESESFRQWFSQIELDEAWYPELAAQAQRCGVDFLSAPTYEKAIALLQSSGVPAFKLASPQVQGNPALLRKAAMTGLPLIMSMGYCDYGDIQRAVAICLAAGNSDLILLHCISKYPATPPEADLGFIATLRCMTGMPVGYSDHTMGSHMAVAAVALGACVIEKHVTIGRDRQGPDHHFSLTFEEFRSMVLQLRDVEQAIGDGTRLAFRSAELQLREKVKLKAIVVNEIEVGERLSSANVRFLRTAKHGLGESELGDMCRFVARRSVVVGTALDWPDIQLA